MMPEIVLDDDDPVYKNLKGMQELKDFLKKVVEAVSFKHHKSIIFI